MSHVPVTPAPTGGAVLLEVLRDQQVRHVFGNPGCTEIALPAALAGQDHISDVLVLHESVAVAMAAGFSQASRRPCTVRKLGHGR